METSKESFFAELRGILDRSGGVAKYDEQCTTRTAPSRRHVCHRVKYLPRFQQLLCKERRLKHRFTLLTVVQLTDALLVQQLLASGLMKVIELTSVTNM